MARVIEKVAKPLPEDFPKPEVLVPVAEQKPKKRGLMSKVKGLFGKK